MTNEMISDVVKNYLQEVGLADGKAVKYPDGSDLIIRRDTEGYVAHIELYFCFDFKARELQKSKEGAIQEMRRVLEPLRESINKSPYVAEILADREMLRQRVKELEPFKTHFDIERQLRGGSSSSSLIAKGNGRWSGISRSKTFIPS